MKFIKTHLVLILTFLFVFSPFIYTLCTLHENEKSQVYYSYSHIVKSKYIQQLNPHHNLYFINTKENNLVKVNSSTFYYLKPNQEFKKYYINTKIVNDFSYIKLLVYIIGVIEGLLLFLILIFYTFTFLFKRVSNE